MKRTGSPPTRMERNRTGRRSRRKKRSVTPYSHSRFHNLVFTNPLNPPPPSSPQRQRAKTPKKVVPPALRTPEKKMYPKEKFSVEGKTFLRYLHLKERIRELQRKIENTSQHNRILSINLQTKNKELLKLTYDRNRVEKRMNEVKSAFESRYAEEFRHERELQHRLKRTIPKLKKPGRNLHVEDYVDFVYQQEHRMKMLDARMRDMKNQIQARKRLLKKKDALWDRCIHQREKYLYKKKGGLKKGHRENYLCEQLKKLSETFQEMNKLSKEQTKELERYAGLTKKYHGLDGEYRQVQERGMDLEQAVSNVKYEIAVARKMIKFKEKELTRVDRGLLKEIQQRQIRTLENEKLKFLRLVDLGERKLYEKNKTLIWQKDELEKLYTHFRDLNEKIITKYYDYIKPEPMAQFRNQKYSSTGGQDSPPTSPSQRRSTLEPLHQILTKTTVEPESRTLVSLREFDRTVKENEKLRKKVKIMRSKVAKFDSEIENVDHHCLVLDKTWAHTKNSQQNEMNIMLKKYELLNRRGEDVEIGFQRSIIEHRNEIKKWKKKLEKLE